MKVDINRKPEDIAYLAGYIDADGYIGLHYRKKVNRYKPYLAISASRKDILEELQAIANVGGSIMTSKKGKDALRLHSRLQYSDRRACKVCELVQPYLRLKGAQAAILVQMGHFRRKHYNQRDFSVNAYYFPRYEEMRRLNEANKSPLIR